MNCIITRLPTANKWKGKPILRPVLEVAKATIASNRSINPTLRDSIIKLRDRFLLAKRSFPDDLTINEYVDHVNSFLAAYVKENT